MPTLKDELRAVDQGWSVVGKSCARALAEIERLEAENASLREALMRIADPRNIHFAGDAQVVARRTLKGHP